MPNRILREGINSSEKIARLTWPEEVFFRRLMSTVDDYGRTDANPQLLRSRCYPLQTDTVSTTDVSVWLDACQEAGLLLYYEVAPKRYVEIIGFHQQRRTPSKFPDPPEVCEHLIANDIKCPQMIANDIKCPQMLANDIICNHLITNAHLGVCVVEGVCGGDVGAVSECECVIPPSRQTPASASPDAEEKKHFSKKSESTADPRFTPVVTGYCEVYADAIGEPYVFNGGRDGVALKGLLKGLANTEYFTIERIVGTAKKAMERRKMPFSKECKHAANLHTFCAHYNDIRAELKTPETNGYSHNGQATTQHKRSI